MWKYRLYRKDFNTDLSFIQHFWSILLLCKSYIFLSYRAQNRNVAPKPVLPFCFVKIRPAVSQITPKLCTDSTSDRSPWNLPSVRFLWSQGHLVAHLIQSGSISVHCLEFTVELSWRLCVLHSNRVSDTHPVFASAFNPESTLSKGGANLNWAA